MGSPVLLFLLIPLTILITVQRLINGVYLLILLMPFMGMFVFEKFGITLKSSDFVAFTCLPFFAMNLLLRPKVRLRSIPLIKPLVFFAVLNIISLLITYPDVMSLSREGGLNAPSLMSIKVTFWCIYSILIAIMICYAIDNKTLLRNCILLFLGITILVCIYSMIGLLGYILHIRAMTWRLVGRGGGGMVGLRGTFDEPSYFAHYMALVLPLALMVFILRIYRLGFFIPTLACFILFITNFFILSTAGIIGTMVIAVLVPYFGRHFNLLTAREAVRLFVIAFIVVLLFFIGGNMLKLDLLHILKVNIEKIFNPYDVRVAGTNLAFKIFREHPFIGVGPGNWRWYHLKLIPPDILSRAFAPSFNNFYLEILLDVGLVGFIFLMWIFISFFRRLAGAIRKTEDRFLQAVLTGFVIGFIALLVEYYACFNFYRIYVWVALGLAMAAIRLAEEEERERRVATKSKQ